MIYIFDDIKQSQTNGIGKFKRNLMSAFDINEVAVIGFNAGKQQLTIERQDGVLHYLIPDNITKIVYDAMIKAQDFAIQGNMVESAKLETQCELLVPEALQEFKIEDKEENTFVFNYRPCAMYVKTLRNFYPKTRFVFVCHNFMWSVLLNGNVDDFVKDPLKYMNNRGVTYHYQSDEDLYRVCNDIVCLSKTSADFLKQLYPYDEIKRKVTFIPNGNITLPVTNTQEFSKICRQFYGIPEHAKLLFYSGRLSIEKGALQLLEAFQRLQKRFTNVYLLLATDAAQYFDPDKTHIVNVGWLNEERLSLFRDIADVCILPSLHEQCSYAGLEYLQSGALIVATDSYGMYDVFKNCALIAKLGTRGEDFIHSLEMTLEQAVTLEPREIIDLKDKAYDKGKMFHIREMRKSWNKFLKK